MKAAIIACFAGLSFLSLGVVLRTMWINRHEQTDKDHE